MNYHKPILTRSFLVRMRPCCIDILILPKFAYAQAPFQDLYTINTAGGSLVLGLETKSFDFISFISRG